MVITTIKNGEKKKYEVKIVVEKKDNHKVCYYKKILVNNVLLQDKQ